MAQSDYTREIEVINSIFGTKGDAGESATITIGTVTTGEPGTEAQVTNSGTSSAAVLDFVIPKGDKGDSGEGGGAASYTAGQNISIEDNVISASSADWDQNDSSADGYIENRPFYSEKVTIDPVYLYAGNYDDVPENPPKGYIIDNNLEEGKEYTIVFSNGKTEISICADDNGMPALFLSDGESVLVCFPYEMYPMYKDYSPFFNYYDFSNISSTQFIILPFISNSYENLHTNFSIKEIGTNTITHVIDSNYIGLNIKNGKGTSSIVEGFMTEASGFTAHAEGNSSKASGSASHAEGAGTTALEYTSHAEGNYTTANYAASHAEGSWTIADGEDQHVEGKYNISGELYAHITGNGSTKDSRSNAYTLDWDGNAWYQGDVYVGSTSGTNKDDGSVKLQKELIAGDGITIADDGRTISSTGGAVDISGKMDKENPTGTGSFSLNRLEGSTVGESSFAEGTDTEASGQSSHAEGNSTKASNFACHAEGWQTKARLQASHAEGVRTDAGGYASHTEGFNTTANGSRSHAEGYGTVASGTSQHTQGQYNISDTTSAHIVGNGQEDSLSNCHTLDWSGNAWFAGDVYVGSTSGTNKDEGSVKLQRELTSDQTRTITFGTDDPTDGNDGDIYIQYTE